MNKKSLLLALITGTAPLIAQDKPSQVLESLMQPLPSVAANIQARDAAFPALRQIPSSACAFVSMADVQGNITKLLNSKLLMAVSEGESAESIAKLYPIENIAFAFDQGAAANLEALISLAYNASSQSDNLDILSDWKDASREAFQESFQSSLKAAQASLMENIFEGVNKGELNIPEMRIIASMKSGSEALVAQWKQQLDAQLANIPLPMPSIEQNGYTIVSLPIAAGLSMIPDLPEGSMDTIVKSQHYLAYKFEGNCISIIYSRDLKKISVASIEQSMLASDKLNLSDARLKDGIVGCSFISEEILNMMNDYDQFASDKTLLKNVFLGLAKHVDSFPVFQRKHISTFPKGRALDQDEAHKYPNFKAAALATEQISSQLNDLVNHIIKQTKPGDYTSILWSNASLNYTEVYNFDHRTHMQKTGKLNDFYKVDLAETISYISMSPIDTSMLISPNFDRKAFMQNAMLIGNATIATLNTRESNQIDDFTQKIAKYSDKIKTASQAICDIYAGTEGSITIYADNKGTSADLCESSSAAEFSAEGKAPRIAILSALSDQAKLASGIQALKELCEKECKLDGKYIFNDKFVSVGNSTALNQSNMIQSSSSKDFTGCVFYFNAKAIAPLIKAEKYEKEIIEAIPELFSVSYPKDNKLFTHIMLK